MNLTRSPRRSRMLGIARRPLPLDAQGRIEGGLDSPSAIPLFEKTFAYMQCARVFMRAIA